MARVADRAVAAPLVFITGASSGIGQALAARYAQLGWRLALVARRASVMHDWAHGLALGVDRVGVYAADVADTDQIIAAAHQCMAQQGLPDVVIANAGISVGMDSSQRADLDVMAQTYALNNLGLAATFHPFIQPMRARGSGRLVGIASVAGIRGMPGHGAYCSSKAAVISYCESLAIELRGTGVGVSTLSPGWIRTPLTAGNPYAMPFMLDADTFAERAVRAIDAGARYRTIPWQMGVVTPFLRMLPHRWLAAAVAGRARKPRADVP